MRYWLHLLLFGVGSLAFAQDGTLNAVRQEVRGSSDKTDSKSNCKDKSSSSDENWSFQGSGTDFNPFSSLAQLVSYNLNPDNFEPTTFVSYPYAEGWPGLLQIGIERNKIDGVTPSTWEHLMSIRASVEEGNNFNGINRLGIVFLADTMTHMGFGGSVNLYEENRNHAPVDQLTIGDFNFYWRHYQTDNAQARIGLGARFMTDRVQTDWGFSMVYAYDWFPKRPLSLGMQLETGTLGDAWVFRATGRIGLVWKFSEVYAGYDYFHIGSQVLQGPMVGLRIWF